MASYRTLCHRCHQYALIGHAYRRWYRVARAVVRRLSDYRMNGTGDPITRIANQERTADAYQTLCDLVAITSPRVSVKLNLQLAWCEFIGQEEPTTMLRSTEAALNHYYRTGEIRGPKTSRFARVLRGDDSVVVVDTWMARALGVADNQARNKSTQRLAERVIAHVQQRSVLRFWSVAQNGLAQSAPWTMAETQAAIWAGMIRTYYKDGKIPHYRTDYVGLYRTGTNGKLSDVPF